MSHKATLRTITFGAVALNLGVMALNILGAWPIALLSLTCVGFLLWNHRKSRRRIEQAQREIEAIHAAAEAAVVNDLRVIVRNGRPVLPGHGELLPGEPWNPADPMGICPTLPPSAVEVARAVEQKAYLNLERIVRATKAEPLGTTRAYKLCSKGREFIVNSSHITDVVSQSMTCYQVNSNMPQAEKIATALLLLHRDPSLFDTILRREGEWVS